VSALANETSAARILLDHWDPLEVADIDIHPEVEYLHEARRVVALLADDVHRSGLVAHLSDERRGLSGRPDPARDQRAADALRDWWSTVDST
jgi:hypothetical protein